MAPILINAGCGSSGAEGLPAYFSSWQHLRVDIDPDVRPDIIADIRDLSVIGTGAADAIWGAHCVEHLFQYEVPAALGKMRQVLKDDGVLIVIVPDLQTIARLITEDRMTETLYESAAGQITPHDVLYGYGAALAAGRGHMAHNTGFTPTSLAESIRAAGFEHFVVIRRAEQCELAVIARKTAWPSDQHRQAQIEAIGL